MVLCKEGHADLTANPEEARQVGRHFADRRTARYARGLMLEGRVEEGRMGTAFCHQRAQQQPVLSGNPHRLPHSGADPWRVVEEKPPDVEGAFGRDERQSAGCPVSHACGPKG